MTKRVWEVCEPHPDVFARDMDPSMFAASLQAVDSGTGAPDYIDAERFFTKTYMTRSLESVLDGVWARLMGLSTGGAPVRRLETPFGGGKTHTMVALYHLAKSPEAVEATEAGVRLRERFNVHHLPQDIRVAVLDGVALDVRGRSVDGLTIHTLWGELAYRLGGRDLFEAVRDADQARTAPGQTALTEMLRRVQPVLVLMDEVMHYLAKARAVTVGNSNLSAQTIAFLRELTAAVDEVSRSALVLSLPASSLEVPAEDTARAEEMFQSVRKVIGRTELIETPVTQDEVFGVLQRRLFKSVGTSQQAKRVVDSFYDYYANYARFFPEKLRSPGYRLRMQQAYPFHPELVDLLYQRWGPHPQFQRTRGALRLLALVLRRLWNQRPGSAYLIQPHHIDLADRHISAEVVRLLDTAFNTIATGDILGRARDIDRELGSDYQREDLGKGAATCAFLYSVSAGREFEGLTEEELRIALLRPQINPAQVSEVLGRLRNSLWHLRYRDQRYFFMAKPNLNKVILDHEQGIAEEKVDEKIAERLRDVSGAGKSPLQVLVAPASEEAVGEPSRATLILLPITLSDPQQWMKQVVDRTTRRNLLIFLAPEKGGEGRLRTSVKRLLALEAVQRAGMFRELDKEDQEEVKDQIKEKQAEVDGLLFSLYSRIFRPAPAGVQEVRVLLKQGAKTLSEAVYTALTEQGVLVDELSPDYLTDVMGVKEREVPLVQIQSVLTGSPEQPIVSRPQEAILQAIRDGVEQGQFAVKVGKQVYRDSVPDEVLSNGQAVLVPIQRQLELEPTPAPSARVLRLHASCVNLYPLRQLLEKLQGHDVKVVMELHDSGGELAKRQDAITKLLRDYSITHEWGEEDET
ncbi:MAG: ATP-binding protein [Armatimonadota bacterium]